MHFEAIKMDIPEWQYYFRLEYLLCVFCVNSKCSLPFCSVRLQPAVSKFKWSQYWIVLIVVEFTGGNTYPLVSTFSETK